MSSQELTTIPVVSSAQLELPHSIKLDVGVVATLPRPSEITGRNYVHVKVDESSLFDDENPTGLDPETITLLWYVDVLGKTIPETTRTIYTQGNPSGMEARASKKLLAARNEIKAQEEVDLTPYSQKVKSVWVAVNNRPKVWTRSDRNLRNGIRLLGDENPWDLTPTGFTIMCRRYGSQSSKEVAKALYVDGDTATAIDRVKAIVSRCRTIILGSTCSTSKLSDYSVRVFALWMAVQGRPNLVKRPRPSEVWLWEELLELDSPPILRNVTEVLGLTIEEYGEPKEVTAAATTEPTKYRSNGSTTGSEKPPAPTTPKQRGGTALPRMCPRCQGSMFPEEDWYGEYTTCLQCGYVHEEINNPPIELLEEEENKSGRRKQRRRQPSHGKIRL